MLINRSNLNNLFVGYSRAFEKQLEARQDEAEWMRIATLIQSGGASTRYPWLGQMPKMREWLGDRVIKQLEAHEFAIRNRKFELTVEVKAEAIEDDNWGVYTPMFEQMGMETALWPSYLVFEALLAGETGLAYDGQPFFSAAHPVGGGTASNFNSDTGDPWYLMDTTRPLKPFIFQRRAVPRLDRLDRPTDENVFMKDAFLYGVRARGNGGYGLWQLARKDESTLNETNFDAAMQAMMELENDEGRRLGIRPNILVVGPSNRAAAKALIETERLASGASNKNFRAVEVLVSSFLP